MVNFMNLLRRGQKLYPEGTGFFAAVSGLNRKTAHHHEPGKAEGYRTDCEAKLQRFLNKSGPSQRSASFLVSAVGFEAEFALQLSEMLERMGLGLLRAALDVDQLTELARLEQLLSYLFVNVDSFADVENAVNELLVFRKLRPEVIVIIISRNFLVDDLGSDRKCICDVSLRAPVSFARFKRGVLTALENYQENNSVNQSVGSSVRKAVG